MQIFKSDEGKQAATKKKTKNKNGFRSKKKIQGKSALTFPACLREEKV
jgi:hypothetical protein